MKKGVKLMTTNKESFIDDKFKKFIIKNRYTKEIVAEITHDEVIPATDYEIILIPKQNQYLLSFGGKGSLP